MHRGKKFVCHVLQCLMPQHKGRPSCPACCVRHLLMQLLTQPSRSGHLLHDSNILHATSHIPPWPCNGSVDRCVQVVKECHLVDV
jgi:hypothetical protein